jgi:hypothetical protein
MSPCIITETVPCISQTAAAIRYCLYNEIFCILEWSSKARNPFQNNIVVSETDDTYQDKIDNYYAKTLSWHTLDLKGT